MASAVVVVSAEEWELKTKRVNTLADCFGEFAVARFGAQG